MKKTQIITVLLLVISLILPIRTIGDVNGPDVSAPTIPTPEIPNIPTPNIPPELPTPSVPDIPNVPSIPTTPPDINLPENPYAVVPVAEAGPNKAAMVGQVVQFDASASYDPNNRPLDCSWYFNWTDPIPKLPQLPKEPITPPNIPTPGPGIPKLPDIPTPVTPNITLPENPLPKLPFSYQSSIQSPDAPEIPVSPKIPEIPIGNPQIPDIPSLPYPLPTSPIPSPDSHEMKPTYIYNTTGVFTVLLIVSNGFAMSTDTLNVTVTPFVRVNHPPIANAGPDQVVNAYDVVRFDGSKSTDPDNDTLSYFWYFGDNSDNTTGTGVKTTHIYTEWEIYYATLTVRDKEYSSSVTVKITVREINMPPIAVAGANQTVELNDLVYFDGSNSYDKNDNPMRGHDVRPSYVIQYYVWSFGDGTSGYGIQATHIYTAPGTYKVTLTVYDKYFSSTDTIYVTVKHLHSIAMSAERNNIEAAPGDVIATKIAVTNIGTIDENISLSAESYFKDWLHLETNSATLRVRQTCNIAVSIEIPVTAKAGTHDFTITSFIQNMSKRYSSPSTLLTISIIQKPKIVVSSDVSTLTMKPGERRAVNISVTNDGNNREAVSLDIGGELKHYVSLPKTPSIIVKENTTEIIQIDITAPSNVTQKRYNVEVILFSESSGTTTLEIPVNVMSTVKDEAVPGFEALYAIGVLFASALLFIKKRK